MQNIEEVIDDWKIKVEAAGTIAVYSDHEKGLLSTINSGEDSVRMMLYVMFMWWAENHADGEVKVILNPEEITEGTPRVHLNYPVNAMTDEPVYSSLEDIGDSSTNVDLNVSIFLGMVSVGTSEFEIPEKLVEIFWLAFNGNNRKLPGLIPVIDLSDPNMLRSKQILLALDYIEPTYETWAFYLSNADEEYEEVGLTFLEQKGEILILYAYRKVSARDLDIPKETVTIKEHSPIPYLVIQDEMEKDVMVSRLLSEKKLAMISRGCEKDDNKLLIIPTDNYLEYHDIVGDSTDDNFFSIPDERIVMEGGVIITGPKAAGFLNNPT